MTITDACQVARHDACQGRVLVDVRPFGRAFADCSCPCHVVQGQYRLPDPMELLSLGRDPEDAA